MNSKQRAYLRSLAMTMPPIVNIGKNGVTDYVHDSPDGSNFFCWHICGRNNRK